MNWKSFISGIVTILVLLGLGGGGYFFGLRQGQKTAEEPEVQDASIGETLKEDSETAPGAIPTPAPSQRPVTLVTAGGVQSFPEYSVSVPNDWVPAHEHDETTGIDTLTLTNDGYEIKIYQAATGGSLCLYPGDAPFEGPSAPYETYTAISGSEGLSFRRSGDEGGTAFTICQMQEDGSFFAPTKFGHVNLTLPAGFDENMLAKMDGMIATLKKI